MLYSFTTLDGQQLHLSTCHLQVFLQIFNSKDRPYSLISISFSPLIFSQPLPTWVVSKRDANLKDFCFAEQRIIINIMNSPYQSMAKYLAGPDEGWWRMVPAFFLLVFFVVVFVLFCLCFYFCFYVNHLQKAVAVEKGEVREYKLSLPLASKPSLHPVTNRKSSWGTLSL